MNADLEFLPAPRPGDASGESRAYTLLEVGRLQCEALMLRQGRGPELLGIHREIGTAAFLACEEFDAGHRADCLANARAKVRGHRGTSGAPGIAASPTEVPHLSQVLALMFSEAIAASDALAGEIATHAVEDAHRDRLHEVHTHVMAACELLDEHLTALELDGAGVTGGL